MKVVREIDENSQGVRPVVAIDGPAGAGKSTAARLLAAQLGFLLIDTGALYRCLAMQAIEKDISLNNEDALAVLAESLEFQFGSLEKHSFTKQGDMNIPRLHIYCNGVEVSDAIRSPEMGMAASNVSKLPKVRQALLEVQRGFGREGGIVMEGRDVGTVIFPEAQLKFFLTAQVENRALRRMQELKAAGIEKELEQVLLETKRRDEQDENRPVAPLKKAEDAILIDSTDKSLAAVVADMAFHVRNYLKNN